ncbi:MAG: hypothetical protein ACYSYL_15280 [Planctomycetota bacterium]|jgi:hypothetical protein
MRVQRNTILVLASIIFVPVLIMTPTEAFATCDQPDAPDCPCFDSNGVWDPVVAAIQDVAIETVGTRESCACPGTDSCDWEIGPEKPFSNGGKPYYQMVLGCNSEAAALFIANLLTWPTPWTPIFEGREAWCSETISYWHREAEIPYPGGYFCGWHCDWLNQNVGALKRWYKTEEDEGGRGRWIDPCEVDYEDYELGVTVPVPGAYVAWRTFDDFNDTWVSDGMSHSLMINEMWIHEDVFGTAFNVEVTLLEGNSGNKVKNTRHWDDVLSLTPQGTEWLGSKKIYGFGIDLDSRGRPVYDESRLHVVTWPYATLPPTRIVAAKDPVWAQYYEPYLPGLRAYAQLMRQAGEPNVTPSTPALPISGIPDGRQVNWLFPKGLLGGVEVVIDLLDIHPLPIKGMELKWSGSALPGDYRVQYASAGQPYQEAIVPQMPDPSQIPQGSSLPVPAIFTTTGNGVQVRYVKLIFPNDFKQDAILQELRFRYYRGPLADTEVCDYILIGDLDHNCRVDFHDVALMAGNWLVDCMENPQNPGCVPE